jgi:type IV pilus assembly protein PilA
MFKKLGSKLKEQKGFTLIELLAVIVILGIIAAIAIPAITNVINKSETKAQAQEGVQIINAAKLYVANEKSNTTDSYVHGSATDSIEKADLMKYLDRVDATTVFEVVVEEATTASGGKFTYKLKNHPAAGAAATDTITETALIEKAK